MQYVVAKINFFDNHLTQEIKEHPSLAKAYLCEAIEVDNVIDTDEDITDIEEIKQRYFDADMMINILELR